MARTDPASRPWTVAAAASCALHAIVVAAAMSGARAAVRREVPTAPQPTNEVAFEAPAPREEPPPEPTPVPTPVPEAAAPPTPRARRAAAPTMAASTGPAAAAASAPAASTPAGSSGEIVTSATEPTARPALRATELMGAGGSLVTSMAAEAEAREMSPEGQRARLRAIAMGPTMDALADSQHTLPAGTMGHDRTVARRAQEYLDPASAGPDLPSQLAAAPVRSMGQIQRTPTAGEVTVGEAMDEAHTQSYRTAQMAPGYAPCQDYRALQVEATLTHDAAGAITDARVLRSSGSRRLDLVAIEALREGHAEVAPARGGTAHTTRWLVEVGENRDAHAALACGATGGWTVWSSRGAGTFGVRVRARRMRER